MSLIFGFLVGVLAGAAGMATVGWLYVAGQLAELRERLSAGRRFGRKPVTREDIESLDI